jgi:tetratricopeptide (TPR) repeat protein
MDNLTMTNDQRAAAFPPLHVVLADRGDAGAQYELGVMYESGHGVRQDFVEAAKWYRKAADQGEARAQYNLACLYGQGQGVALDHAESVKWYRRAAEQGNPYAQNNLGVMYETGLGTTQDHAEAVKWYRKAAEQGIAAARGSQVHRVAARGHALRDLERAGCPVEVEEPHARLRDSVCLCRCDARHHVANEGPHPIRGGGPRGGRDEKIASVPRRPGVTHRGDPDGE